MKHRGQKDACVCAARHLGPCAPAEIPPPTPDYVGQVAMEAPRNKAADLARLEAMYVSLTEAPFVGRLDWAVLRSFRAELASAIAELRLR